MRSGRVAGSTSHTILKPSDMVPSVGRGDEANDSDARRIDPRIDAQIWAALGDTHTVLNVAPTEIALTHHISPVRG
jgi:hypothetical protein